MSYIDSDLDVFLQEPFGQKVHYAGGTKIGILDMPDQISVSYTHLTLPTTG